MNENSKIKETTIIVNGRAIVVDGEKSEITYTEIVSLAFPNPAGTFRVTYRGGKGNAHPKELAPNGSVKIEEGMEFTITQSHDS